MENLKTVSPAELSEITGIPVRTLGSWRVQGMGPAYVKAEGQKGAIRYRLTEVEEWMKKNTYNSNDK